jgi:hypothetical protein
VGDTRREDSISRISISRIDSDSLSIPETLDSPALSTGARDRRAEWLGRDGFRRVDSGVTGGQEGRKGIKKHMAMCQGEGRGSGGGKKDYLYACAQIQVQHMSPKDWSSASSVFLALKESRQQGEIRTH